MIFSDSETDDNESKNSPKIQTEETKDSFNVIDVCSNRTLFDTFTEELKSQKEISITLACDKWTNPVKNDPGAMKIGQRITRRTKVKDIESRNNILCIESLSLKVTGVAFCFGGLTSYFVSLTENNKTQAYINDTIAPGSQDDKTIEIQERLKVVQMGFRRSMIGIFDLKTCLKVIHLGLFFPVSYF